MSCTSNLDTVMWSPADTPFLKAVNGCPISSLTEIDRNYVSLGLRQGNRGTGNSGTREHGNIKNRGTRRIRVKRETEGNWETGGKGDEGNRGKKGKSETRGSGEKGEQAKKRNRVKRKTRGTRGTGQQDEQGE